MKPERHGEKVQGASGIAFAGVARADRSRFPEYKALYDRYRPVMPASRLE